MEEKMKMITSKLNIVVGSFVIVFLVLNVMRLKPSEANVYMEIKESYNNYAGKMYYSYKQTGKKFNVSLDYLRAIGFPIDKTKYVKLDETTAKDFIFVTASSSNHFPESMGAVRSIQDKFPHYKILYYDIGLNKQQLNQLSHFCNVKVKKFNFTRHPRNVKILMAYMWKILILHEVLQKYPGVYWFDSSARFLVNETTFYREKIPNLLKQSDGMMLSKVEVHSTFAATHPDMYTYIPTDKARLKTIYQGSINDLLIYRTRVVCEDIMPWYIMCALDMDCVKPKSSRQACKVAKDPKARLTDYMGCHRHDQSLINIILANYYNFNQKWYIFATPSTGNDRRRKNQAVNLCTH